MEKGFGEVLKAIEFDLPCRVTAKTRAVIGGDKWLMASGLQKAIRRGDTDKAGAFACALWQADRRMFWRRLHVAALEDVSVASPDAVIKTIAAHETPIWRRDVAGDKAVGVYLSRLLAKVPKTRFTDELLMYCESAKELGLWRKKLAKASPARLEAVVLDHENDIAVRATAIWLLAGTKAFPSKVLPKQAGDLERTAGVLRKLNAPPMLTEACIAVLPRTQWLLSAFTVLAYGMFRQEESELRIREEALSAMQEFEGIPLYAIDGQFTRIGGTCIRQLRKETPELQKYTPQQVAQAAFYVEGESLGLRMSSKSLDAFRRKSIEAVMEAAGVQVEEYQELDSLLRKLWPRYDEIRLQRLKVSLYGAQPDLFSKQ